ncbi:MAG: hypothetical protein GWO39_05370, partial [Gammaproteobacteria bacterium]|nr:hypothetical protein [Gammaproteobacteria bacterium]NIT63232.1 hypothetical protein [Gammaproteobacteria bacterium]NIY31812.1 hypothetical protein [Gammaproteobacteria bacterium]
LGSRLEGLNKRYGTRIIVSEATYAAVKDQLLCRELDSVRVKGKDTPTRIFEVLGEEVDDAALQSAVSAYEQALACYRRADWDCAIRHLEWALRQRAGDGPSRALLERCHSLKASPPPADWDGVTALQSK